MSACNVCDHVANWPLEAVAKNLIALGKCDEMAGCRALTDDEVALVQKSFKGRFAKRNFACFQTAIFTGFRVSELLSIKVSDVIQHDQFKTHILVNARFMKGKKRSRSVAFHQAAKDAIAAYLAEYQEKWGRPMTPDMYLFRSQQGVNRRMSRTQIAKIMHDIYDSLKFTGKLGMHATRKTYAVRLYKIFGKDLVKTQRAMDHDNINSTVKYLQDYTTEEIESAILSM